MATDLIPWGLIVFVLVYGLDLYYTVTFRKKHVPPEGTPLWVYWVDLVCVWCINPLFLLTFPIFTWKFWGQDAAEQWLEWVEPIVRNGFAICILVRFVIHYYYKFRKK